VPDAILHVRCYLRLGLVGPLAKGYGFVEDVEDDYHCLLHHCYRHRRRR